jgi:hypothetical protein
MKITAGENIYVSDMIKIDDQFKAFRMTLLDWADAMGGKGSILLCSLNNAEVGEEVQTINEHTKMIVEI